MKKKILLTLAIVAVFTCLFALAVSAADIVHNGIYYSTTVTDAEAKIGTASVNANNATQCTLTDVVIPSSFTYEDGITYTVTAIDYHAFSGAQSSWGKNQTIQSLYIPETVSSIGAHFLRECKSIKTVVIKAKNANGISLPDAEFYNCTSLTSVDMSESDITVFGQYTFNGCSSLTSIELPPRLKTVGSQSFRYCSSLTSLDFLNTKLETIGSFAFNSCSKLETLRFSTCLKTINGNAIQGVKVTELILPHGFNKISGDAIPALSSLYLMIFPEVDETASFSGSTFYGTYPEVVLYAGDKDSCEKYLVGTADNKKLLYGYNVLPISDYDPNKTYSGKNLFYGAVTCTNCNGLYASEEEQFVFTDYTTDMKYGKLCSHCEKVVTTKTVDAMFENLGWTAPMDGGAASIRYKVNKASIQVYIDETGKTVEYGMYATIKDVLDENEIIDANGDAGNGTALVFVSKEFVNLEIKLLGIGENQKDILFALGAFVKETTEDSVTYKLLEYASPKDGDKYYFTSFNEIIENN